MHLMIEEAHLVAPQRARGSEAMAAAVEDIVRLGRNYGIGVTLISQKRIRPSACTSVLRGAAITRRQSTGSR